MAVTHHVSRLEAEHPRLRVQALSAMTRKGRRGRGPVETSAGRGRPSRARRAWRRVRATSDDGSDHAQNRHGKENHGDGTVAENRDRQEQRRWPARARLSAPLAEQGRSPQRWRRRPLPPGARRRSERAIPRQAPLSERMNLTDCRAVVSPAHPLSELGRSTTEMRERRRGGTVVSHPLLAGMRETSSVRAAFQRPCRRLGFLVRTRLATTRRGCAPPSAGRVGWRCTRRARVQLLEVGRVVALP